MECRIEGRRVRNPGKRAARRGDHRSRRRIVEWGEPRELSDLLEHSVVDHGRSREERSTVDYAMADGIDGGDIDSRVLDGAERLAKRLGGFADAAHWNSDAGLGVLRILAEHTCFQRRRAGVQYE